MNTQQAQLLANKLDKLNEFFDITESTVQEIAKQVEDIDYEEVSSEIDDNIITIDLLKKDFLFIRETLLETVKNGKTVIGKLSLEIEVQEGSSGNVISAYAELVATVNNSLKLLSGTYKDIIEMNIKLKKLDSEKESKDFKINGDLNVTNNTIQASVKDIVNAMQMGRNVEKIQ